MSDSDMDEDAFIADALRDGVFDVDERAFATHLSAFSPLDGLNARDLYLAFAASRGDPRAIVELRNVIAPAIARVAARTRQDADELTQRILDKLLVRQAITKYAGRGLLVRWVQTVALREAQSRARNKQDKPVDDIGALADRVIDFGDPELQAMKGIYRAQFKEAFIEAFATLTSRQRNLLRLELIDELTIGQIAALYSVHGATISRWRTQTRDTLLSSTRRVFQQRLNISKTEFNSILRLIESHLEVSLPRLLRKDE